MGHGCNIIRLKYGKTGAGKYISHLDTIRGAERALRRMGLPLLYSEGFTPRPRMSFAAALQVGVSSIAEHMDIFLSEPVSVIETISKAEDAFSESMPIIAAGLFDGSYPLPAKVAGAVYDLRPYGKAVGAWRQERLAKALIELMEMPGLEIAVRQGKTKEARSLILDAKADEGALAVILACGNRNLRPQEFIEALSLASGEDFGVSQAICRTGLLLDLGAGLVDPMSGCDGVCHSNKFRS